MTDVAVAQESWRASEDPEHLRWCLEALTTPPPDYLRLMRCEPHLTRSEARLVGALMASPDRIMTREALMAAIHFDKSVDDWPEHKIIDVYVCKARAKLRRHGVPFEIDNVFGVGFVGRGGVTMPIAWDGRAADQNWSLQLDAEAEELRVRLNGQTYLCLGMSTDLALHLFAASAVYLRRKGAEKRKGDSE